MLIGSSLFLGYDMIRYWCSYEDHANTRPRFYDHTFATTLMTTAGAAFVFKHPAEIFAWFVIGLTLVSPTTWLIHSHNKFNLHKMAPNIFYENGCTKDDISRYRHQDEIENLGWKMARETGAGYVNLKDPRNL